MDDAESSSTGTCSVTSPVVSTSNNCAESAPLTGGMCYVTTPVPSTSTNFTESVPFKEIAPIPKYISKNKDTNKNLEKTINSGSEVSNVDYGHTLSVAAGTILKTTNAICASKKK